MKAETTKSRDLIEELSDLTKTRRDNLAEQQRLKIELREIERETFNILVRQGHGECFTISWKRVDALVSRKKT